MPFTALHMSVSVNRHSAGSDALKLCFMPVWSHSKMEWYKRKEVGAYCSIGQLII